MGQILGTTAIFAALVFILGGPRISRGMTFPSAPHEIAEGLSLAFDAGGEWRADGDIYARYEGPFTLRVTPIGGELAALNDLRLRHLDSGRSFAAGSLRNDEFLGFVSDPMDLPEGRYEIRGIAITMDGASHDFAVTLSLRADWSFSTGFWDAIMMV